MSSRRPRRQFGRVLKLLGSTLLGVFFGACGGGGSSGGGGSPPPPPPPQFVISTSSLQDAITGQNYNQVLTAANGTQPFSWSVLSGALPPGLSLATSGTISGVATSIGSFTFTARVSDSASNVATKQLSIFSAAPLTFINSPFQNGNVGVAYNGGVVYSGGHQPVTWSLAPGSAPLPSGLTLQPSGAVNGTPTAFGTFTFTVLGTDSGTPAQTATGMVTITILNNLIITSADLLPQGTVSRSYSTSLAAVGGTAPYTWSVSGATPLPSGLSLDPASGQISGTPSGPSNANHTITVTDSAMSPNSVSKSFWLIIVDVLTIQTLALGDGVRSSPYGSSIFFTGGKAPYAATVFSGALPNGLSINQASVQSFQINFNGFPTTLGTFNFTIQISDSSSPPFNVSQPYVIRVFEPITFPTTSLPDGFEGVAYSATLSAAGGLPPYTWNGTPPLGLSVSPSGVVSGVPLLPFNGDFCPQVSDSANPPQIICYAVSLRIRGVLRLPTVVPPIVVGTPARLTLAASGGTPPYVITQLSGTLPAGLSFTSGNREIFGVATAAESQVVTFGATDSSSPPLSVQQALTINTVAAAGRNDSIATATPLSNGTYSASLSPGDNGAGGYSPDRDYYVVTAKAGVTVTVDIRAQRLAPPSLMDSVVQILDANGNEFTTCRMTSQGAFDNFCTNDDLASGGSTDSYLEFQVPGVPGTPVTFYIRVLEWRGMARPDFVYTITIAGAN